ncbi:MAG: diaminopimelate epimerase [Candidatus Paraimprobicoccus trichonymphae]|uniref:Diaminopimelate epimerase n=1 Tax=Candidatus Paraimprobicoccus trichonymphae TaxID=3033793 RepID=A0AA48I6M6_9FIRM|nr:MAG: diaminopimelate epimerase [Candidatus Paraimprobicoccus trichonymphae]
MILRFTKMHGCGNSYVYVDGINQNLNNLNLNELSIKFSDKNFGIGSDGVIFIFNSTISNAKMKMFNSDGSEGSMCGNGIRCTYKFLLDKKIIKNIKKVNIETKSGIKSLYLIKNENNKALIKVNMGTPEFNPKKIPVLINKKEIIQENILINNIKYKINCVSIGNPHCVIFKNEISNLNLNKFYFYDNIFPKGVNVEFAKILNKNKLKLRVLERGSGETLSCGTGACASVVMGVKNGLLKENFDIKVKLLGGELTIHYDTIKNIVYMTGEAVSIFDGMIKI